MDEVEVRLGSRGLAATFSLFVRSFLGDIGLMPSLGSQITYLGHLRQSISSSEIHSGPKKIPFSVEEWD